MSGVDHSVMLRPWVPWALGLVAATQTWALVDNVLDRSWILAGCFGLSTIALIAQIVVLVWLRRKAGRCTAGDPTAAPREI